MNAITRRHFLHRAAVGAAAFAQTAAVLRGAAPDRPLKLGLIGCGWYGMVDVEAAWKVGGVEVVALCDVDSEHLSQSADKVEKRQGSRPRTFKHHADLLEASFWQAHKDRILAGHVHDVFPYDKEKRFRGPDS